MSEARVERRLAAILAADVVGYSRLMGEDEAGTLARLRALRRDLIDPKIAEYKGRLVKTTGDGLLVEFSSVVEAVACAAAVQRAMPAHEAGVDEGARIGFRIGINLGDVIVEDGDIHGNGVNVAARLEAIAEPGGICVSAVVRDQVQGRLDCAFDDVGDQVLKNIARPVRVYRVRPAAHAAATMSASAALSLPDKPSVAVVPFANMSSDPEQEFLADGVAEDVITTLSRYPSLFVVARNSCFTYKGRAVEIRQLGRELGVRYVLEGSLRKAGNRIRVTAQLIEAATGNHVWAERYDSELDDIFAVQDEISQAVTIAIAPAIAQAEQQRAIRKPPDNLDAWAAYQRGLWHLYKTSVDDLTLATQFFEQAIKLDPSFAGGYRGLAHARLHTATIHGLRSIREAQQLAEPMARRAVASDASDAEARSCLSYVLWARGDLAGARAEAERALDASPNLALGHAALGTALVFSGFREEGRSALEKSIRLNPYDHLSSTRLNQIAISHYFSGEYDAALGIVEKAIRAFPDYPLIYRWHAAALGQLGRLQEAKEALDGAIAISPTSFEAYVRNRVPWMQPADHEHMLDGLRKAGWPG